MPILLTGRTSWRRPRLWWRRPRSWSRGQRPTRRPSPGRPNRPSKPSLSWPTWSNSGPPHWDPTNQRLRSVVFTDHLLLYLLILGKMFFNWFRSIVYTVFTDQFNIGMSPCRVTFWMDDFHSLHLFVNMNFNVIFWVLESSYRNSPWSFLEKSNYFTKYLK